jgi:hypothetical protein
LLSDSTVYIGKVCVRRKRMALTMGKHPNIKIPFVGMYFAKCK